MLNLINAYENYLTKVKQASANTVFSYMRDIRQYAQWLQQNGEVDVLEASQLNISMYLEHLQNEGRSAATVSRSLASLKNFYSYVVTTGFLETSPVTTQIHVGDYLEKRDAALRAHRTQVDPEGPFFAAPSTLLRRTWPWEDYVLIDSRVETTLPETDLFTGLR